MSGGLNRWRMKSVYGLIITEEKDEKLDFALKPVSDLIKQKLIKIDIKFIDKWILLKSRLI